MDYNIIMSGNGKKFKGIPYGISDYGEIQADDFYYVDKTTYLPLIENAGRYLFFIRPRRFGKSLMLSMMEYYYDAHQKDRFEELFKDTWIYDHPTDEQGKYLVLTFNFSLVASQPDKVENSFLEYVEEVALKFIKKNNRYLSADPDLDYTKQKIKTGKTASDILSTLFSLCKSAGQKVYVLIDEYDNFANNILSEKGKSAYHNLTHGTGFFRSFFNVLKGGTGGTDSPVTRSFITGVSPITMDDVTSGYNIGKHISLDPTFNAMLGFTEADVTKLLHYYRGAGMIDHDCDHLSAIFKEWYGNYRFSKRDETQVFNSDMVLYFLDQYLPMREMPEDPVDRNVRTDYRKLQQLIVLDRETGKTTNGNFGKLKQIIAEGHITSSLVTGFPMEEMIEHENFVSLLFYFGLLTIEDIEKGQLRLVVPNETMRRLYYDYINKAYRDTGTFHLNISKYKDLMGGMAYYGEWRPLLEFLTQKMKDSMSLRDLIDRERAVQAFLNVYLGLSDFYVVHPERELNMGYADLVLEPLVDSYPGMAYSYIVEIKYLKKGETNPANIRAAVEAAEDQLRQYTVDPKYRKTIGKTTLIEIVMVFSGPECLYLEPLS